MSDLRYQDGRRILVDDRVEVLTTHGTHEGVLRRVCARQGLVMVAFDEDVLLNDRSLFHVRVCWLAPKDIHPVVENV